jgi:hypothetical protein
MKVPKLTVSQLHTRQLLRSKLVIIKKEGIINIGNRDHVLSERVYYSVFLRGKKLQILYYTFTI